MLQHTTQQKSKTISYKAIVIGKSGVAAKRHYDDLNAQKPRLQRNRRKWTSLEWLATTEPTFACMCTSKAATLCACMNIASNSDKSETHQAPVYRDKTTRGGVTQARGGNSKVANPTAR